MWLVDRHAKGLTPTRILLPTELCETLKCWYDGSGTTADEQASIILVQQARRHRKWVACGCLGDDVEPPLMSPAFLSEAETYYFRRLTGQGRATHQPECPYFREQAPFRLRDRITPSTVRAPADGYFQVLKPVPEHLAQAPYYTPPDDRTRGASIPRLARLIWEMLEASERNILPPVVNTKGQGARSIRLEFAAIREAAKFIEVAPGIRLADVLFTHIAAYEKEQVFAKLRQLAPIWPKGHAPQAFLLLFTTAISSQTLYLSNKKSLDIATRVLNPSTRYDRIDGPFLSLIVVGTHPDAHGYDAVGAYAQPINTGMRFLPIFSNIEREIIRALDDVRWTMHRRNIDIQITKPLFDRITTEGLLRPDFVLDCIHQLTGEMKTIVLDLERQLQLADSEAVKKRDAHLASIGSVIKLGKSGVSTLLNDVEAILLD